MALNIHAIRASEYEDTYAFQREYGLSDESFTAFKSRVERYPEYYLTACDVDKIVGVCFGTPSAKEMSTVILQGIAVNLDKSKHYARVGIGSKMLRQFEDGMAHLGYQKIGVGAAEDEKVERFYLKNGYHAVQLVAKTVDGKELERVDASSYESGLQTRVQLHRAKDVHEVIFIFEARLREV